MKKQRKRLSALPKGEEGRFLFAGIFVIHYRCSLQLMSLTVSLKTVTASTISDSKVQSFFPVLCSMSRERPWIFSSGSSTMDAVPFPMMLKNRAP